MCVQVMLRHGLVFTFSQEGLVGATNLNTLAVHLIAIKVRKNEKNGLFSLSLNGCASGAIGLIVVTKTGSGQIKYR
jgi:hypothetical protein